MLDHIQHRKLLLEAIIMRKNNLETVMKLLIEWNAVEDQRIIDPTEEEFKMIQEERKQAFMKLTVNSKIDLSTHAESKIHVYICMH